MNELVLVGPISFHCRQEVSDLPSRNYRLLIERHWAGGTIGERLPVHIGEPFADRGGKRSPPTMDGMPSLRLSRVSPRSGKPGSGKVNRPGFIRREACRRPHGRS